MTHRTKQRRKAISGTIHEGPVLVSPEDQKRVSLDSSESTIYRIMREEGLLSHRGRARPVPPARPVPVLEATGIHQVLAWDITLLLGPAKGQFFYLYMVTDVWSWRILGVEVHERECGQLASTFFDRVCRDQGINNRWQQCCTQAKLHPMHSWLLAATLAELGVASSFSRPRVSNDNAYAESWFRTMKCHQSYPLRSFRDPRAVRAWVYAFVDWYTTEYRHSGIQYVTPDQHHGQADAICIKRQQTYEQDRLGIRNAGADLPAIGLSRRL